ncbi:MAG: hypothetical protein AB8G99_02545 [Planctomycetaceae bacterium]
MESIWIIAGVLGLMGVIFYFSHAAAKRRTEAMEGIAQELGLDFFQESDSSVAVSLGKLRLFDRGRKKRFMNMMTGTANGVRIAIFEYRYTTGSGKHQHTHQQTVISFQSDLLSLPDFELRPEHMFHKIGQAFGYKDIDFATHPRFSKQYLLRGPGEQQIRELFEPALLEFFEDQKKGVCVEAGHSRLIFYRAGKRLKPEQIRDFMTEGFGVYSMLKQSNSQSLT